MCSPQVAAAVREAVKLGQGRIDRRRFFGGGAAALAGSVMVPSTTAAQQATPVATPVASPGTPFSAIHDLTHVVSSTFPVFAGATPMEIDTFLTVADDGFYKNMLTLDEHTGTHIDAPAHFVEGATSAEDLSVENFFAPLCVVDIASRAAENPDALVEVADLTEWEAANGPVPDRAFVAMYSGWEECLSDPDSFVNLDADGVQHYPGFSGDAAAFLANERTIVGIGTDTLSLDPGNSADFTAHINALGAGLYGVESLANLGSVPPVGATIIVGSPKHEGASGGPARVFAVEI